MVNAGALSQLVKISAAQESSLAPGSDVTIIRTGKCMPILRPLFSACYARNDLSKVCKNMHLDTFFGYLVLLARRKAVYIAVGHQTAEGLDEAPDVALRTNRKMKNLMLKVALTVAALVICLAPNAHADTASMDLTSAGSNVYGGVYIGPYTATITPSGSSTGTVTPVICDDFGDESYVPETWTANVSNESAVASNSSILRFGSQSNYIALYNEASWLAVALTQNVGNNAEVDAIQAAIWNILDPADVASNTFGFTLPGGSTCTTTNSIDQAACWQKAATAAEGANTTMGEFSNVTIYSFASCTTTVSSPCSTTNPPQEFMVVNTPEPSTLLMLALGIGGLLMFWRRQRNAAVLAA